MIKDLISSEYLKTPRIIDAFQKIDRKDFVPEKYKDEAYVNVPLPIGYGQTISQPLTVAFILELLQPEEGNKVLDIGSGSGWQTALLAEIVGNKGKIFAMEIVPEICEFGKKNILKYDFIKRDIVKFICANASGGLSEEAPFDKIIAAASSEKISESWKEQLKVNGRLVAPVRDSVWFLIKHGENDFEDVN
jgi:protein-L-isoaspartate(D-aspartate) O-methyltransferase